MATEVKVGGSSKFPNGGGVTSEESPPDMESPQVTTEPSFFKAAKANWLDEIDVTPEARSPPTGLEESPPKKDPPQVTTEPFDFRAAKALGFEKMAVTFEVRFAETEEESPPDMEAPQVTTEPFDFNAAKALSFEKTAVTFEEREPPAGAV